jgi:hypothetical protein
MSWVALRDWGGGDLPVRLSQLPDAELAQHLRALLRQGPAELSRVVESLVAKRTALQSAAARTLHEEIEFCAKATANDSAERLDQIARLLATYAPQLNDDALATAAALAERILAAPLRAANISERLRNCHIVLKEEAQRRMKEQARSPDGNSRSAFRDDARPKGPGPALRSAVTVTMPPIPGGGLAATPGNSHPRRLPQPAASQAKPLGIQAIDSGGASSTSRLNSPSQVNAASMDSGAKIAASLLPGGRNNPAPSTDQINGVASDVPSVEKATAQAPIPRDLARLLELVDRVRFGSSPQSAANRAELSWLGIDESQLKLARGAVDNDPRVRKEVVEALPLVGNVDVRGWLLWLSHDRDVEVRRAAIALLATAADPELKKRVREAAESDADPRVRAHAQAAVESAGTR